MLRRIHTLFTLVAALLLLGVLALWWRTHDRTDTLVLRAAPSYMSGPPLKWVSLNTADGLVVSLYTKIVPAISSPTGPRWRDDVTLSTTAPGIETAGEQTRLLGAMRPDLTGATLMSVGELREYESLVETDYTGSAVLRHEVGPPPWPQRVRGQGGWVVERLGIWSFGPDVEVYDEDIPGAYREVRFRLPFALAVAACTLLLLTWVPGHLKRGRARRRLLRRECPECGYDLRSSPVQCPECGHAVDDQEERRARMGRTESLWMWVRATDRRTLAERGAVIATVVVAILVVRTNAGSTAASRTLRREFDERLAFVTDEANRLRAAGDSALADRLDADMRMAQRQLDGPATGPTDEPELHVIAVDGSYDFRATSRSHPTAVNVTTTERPLVLALWGFDGCEWFLQVADGVRIEKLMLEGGRGQTVQGLPTRLPIEDHGANGERNLSKCVRLFGDDPDTRREVDVFYRHHTGLTSSTFHYRDTNRRDPVAIGPSSATWNVKRALSQLEPAYARARALQRDRALAAVRDVRFTADWTRSPHDSPSASAARGPAVPVPMSGGFCGFLPMVPGQGGTALFDVRGPIRSSFVPIPNPVVADATDYRSIAWIGHAGHGNVIGLDRRTNTYVRVWTPHQRSMQIWPTSQGFGMALDSRRGRLMTLAGDGAIKIYRLATEEVETRPALGSRQRYASLTYSDHDDCFYALGSQVGERGVTVMTVTRVTPDGQAEWQIPVRERVAERGPGGQILSAGKYLAIFTMVIGDPAAPQAWPTRHCVLLDPHTNTVLYSGPIAQHDTPAPPPSAPAPRP